MTVLFKTQNPKPPRIPVYRHAIEGICKFQLRLCTKLLQSKPSNSPTPLKDIASYNIIRRLCGLKFDQETVTERHLIIEALRKTLPNDLVNFLHFKEKLMFL